MNKTHNVVAGGIIIPGPSFSVVPFEQKLHSSQNYNRDALSSSRFAKHEAPH